jgi:hypothetical protein
MQEPPTPPISVDVNVWGYTRASTRPEGKLGKLGPDQPGENLAIVDPAGVEPMIVIPAPAPGATSWQALRS